MALFDFLKKKEYQEKIAQRAESKKAPIEKATEAPKAKEAEERVPASLEAQVSTEGVLITPHITERARALAEIGQYVFRINRDANKAQVKKSVQGMYGVNVEGVKVITVHEKKRRRGLTEGVKKGYKKAVVSLREGEKIDIF
ncbi:MAG: 50S ribosomal protein L23 [bacterium]|nr:50S ribosomal protein L23 [bacterium]